LRIIAYLLGEHMKKKVLPPDTALFPVPATLVSYVDKHSKPNIVSLAWVGIVSSVPPHIGLGIAKSRYSHACIKAKEEFVVNIPTEDMTEALNKCGTVSGREKDKFEYAKLTPEKSLKVNVPIIKECPVNLECKLKKIVELGGSHDYFIGEVVAVHADEDVLSNGNIDASKLSYVGYVMHNYFGKGKEL